MDCFTPLYCCYILLLFSGCDKNTSTFTDPAKTHGYYFSSTGNDKSDGSFAHPFKTIDRLNKISLKSGDSALFEGGSVFVGEARIGAGTAGSKSHPVVVSSYGTGLATINGENGTAITLSNLTFIEVKNLVCKGAGRKTGNVQAGVLLINCHNISVDNLDISGFQKSGLQINTCTDITINRVYAHDNGAAGIGVEGVFSSKLTTRNILISACIAENNPGDPSNLTNHSGNGIVVGHCTHVVIDHCMATNNGWDMPRIGNGPVGIWGYEADSLVIQHCLAYRNKTSPGAADGGGFDFDGGVTNSIIQYCYSYENQGSGYCMFQYWSASPWYNNVIRYNISENDGLVSDSRAGIYVWNSAGDESLFHDCDFYNNTIYNSKQAALSFSTTSQRKNFRFFNNIFVAKDSLIRGPMGHDLFLANDWWSIDRGFNAGGVRDFTAWITQNNIEQIGGVVSGLNILPPFQSADNSSFTDAASINTVPNYKIADTSTIAKAALDLSATYQIDIGVMDFNGQPIDKNCIGACSRP